MENRFSGGSSETETSKESIVRRQVGHVCGLGDCGWLSGEGRGLRCMATLEAEMTGLTDALDVGAEEEKKHGRCPHFQLMQTT